MGVCKNVTMSYAKELVCGVRKRVGIECMQGLVYMECMDESWNGV